MNTAQLPFALLVGIVTAAATVVGGTLAIRFRSAKGMLFGFSSGAVVGVALLDLLPEALDLVGPDGTALSVTTAAACGFAGYCLLDRSSAMLFGQQDGHGRYLGPGSLTMHSLMDGLGIGLAFQVSSAAGVIVAIAVLAHDFLDGANTVTLSFVGGGSVRAARRWLALDALAPLIGIAIARMVVVPVQVLALLLGVFAGGFLYIGASELLPRSRDGETGLARAGATALGLAFIYLVVRLAAL
ncbi:ZIP family metal transporter [uncultured Sphingomonas sp.]|uniref:ZIP family metal transporter n=1 Tax=uncultured Sphingomonas sp. TaxID=158754 RepID=UPI0035CB6A23